MVTRSFWGGEKTSVGIKDHGRLDCVLILNEKGLELQRCSYINAVYVDVKLDYFGYFFEFLF